MSITILRNAAGKILRTRGAATTVVEYGALYNWYAASDARNVASAGWHTASPGDWITLANYCGGSSVAGGKLKTTGTSFWDSPNTGATNEFGFNAKGCGQRAPVYADIYFVSAYWSSESDIPSSLGIFGGVIVSPSTTLYVNDDPEALQLDNKNEGHSIIIMKDSTTLIHGQTGTYTGNDGKVYPTICIGTQEWLSCTLYETKYRNGDWINGFNGGVYTPISDAAWAALTTGAMCYYNDLESNAGTVTYGIGKILRRTLILANSKYGYLYNWYAATGGVLVPGWHVPTIAEWDILRDSNGGWEFIGGKLKETGIINWNTPNTGADNSLLFNALGTGIRSYTDGVFSDLKTQTIFQTSGLNEGYTLSYNNSWLGKSFGNTSPRNGCSVRLICNSTTDPGFVDIDGKRYKTVKIGNQVWMAENLQAKRYANGVVIPEVTDNTAWANLTTPGLCVYNNDLSNI